MSNSKPFSSALPKQGFDFFPLRLMAQGRYDKYVQRAIRQAGIRFDRANVVPVFTQLFEMAANILNVAPIADKHGDGSDENDTALRSAISECQDKIDWVTTIGRQVFYELVTHILAARRRFMAIHQFDDTELGSYARTLGVAVDKFDDAIRRHGWGRGREMRSLEGFDDSESEEEEDACDEMEICEELGTMSVNMTPLEEEGEKELCRGVESMEIEQDGEYNCESLH
ncbi:hypothetical protein GE09DRAFT_1077368 [Coniochaeta sp. 2T2.1]|nr:hypothetical protein GE09DRAFT_1077368 [Coniochaeta sp. 2T2.1]